jgi:hypothetical protein
MRKFGCQIHVHKRYDYNQAESVSLVPAQLLVTSPIKKENLKMELRGLRTRLVNLKRTIVIVD